MLTHTHSRGQHNNVQWFMLVIPLDLCIQSTLRQVIRPYIGLLKYFLPHLSSQFFFSLSPFVNSFFLISASVSYDAIASEDESKQRGLYQTYTSQHPTISATVHSENISDILAKGCLCSQCCKSLWKKKKPRTEVKQRSNLNWYPSVQQLG